MAEVREELTPMLSQYFELCSEYDDALVLFQVGDFYETFCEAAEETARVCEVTLTKREDSTGRYPMAGIPIDNAAKYLERLLDAGYRVAVADQVEDAAAASGLVDRAVTRIVTPGTVVDDELLAPGANYVAGVVSDADRWGLAAVDVSTGECLVTGTDDRDRLREELNRLAPAELVVGPDASVDTEALDAVPMVSDVAADAFDPANATDRLASYVAAPDAAVPDATERRAVGGVLAYAEYTQGDDGPLEYVSRVRRYDPRASLRLDSTALRSLELFENRGGGSGRTLFDVVDETASALGRRRLSSWLRRPLVDADEIARRHDAVAELAGDAVVRETLADHLADVYDLERLIGSVSRGRANARDLRSLCATLGEVPPLREALADADAPLLGDLRERMDPLDDVRSLVDRAIVEDPPIEVTEGGVVAAGFDAELDDLRATEREGREWVADLEARERERTGIDSLSVGHNEVHGYYIEVTNPNLDRVPDDYTRRQTLKNSERFYTPELKRREDEILGAAERADKLEYERFREVRDSVAAAADRVQTLADALAALDALTSLATVAVEYDYARPELGADGVYLTNGRHPVVERTSAEFVPNDADLPRGTVAVVTGPNMSGKSTYMRQVALCCVLAQAGSFVPADAARLPVVDRVFTRVGASDDIAGGQSTFMREMAELTRILHDATEDSLVLLDEVGRGTSTADGLAIAWATTEFVHDEVGATTLFATHYHDLTALADEREDVRNLHFAADRDPEDGSVTFLHRVAEGAASSSYGVEVARMAGVPDPVVERSAALVDDPPAGARDASATTETRPTAAQTAEEQASDAQPTGPPPTDAGSSGSTPRLTADERAVLDAVRDLDVATTTPMEALNALYDLQRKLQ
jgi:DNA mismatch repair protein MutS